MDQFVKLRKKMSIAESTRQMLNKSIDLLHKLSKKKITTDAVKKELSTYLSNHILTLNQVDSGKKFELEQFLHHVGELVDSVDAGKIPLYEGIMTLNRLVMPEDESLEDVPKKVSPPPFIRMTPIPEMAPIPETLDRIEKSGSTITHERELQPPREIGELVEVVLKNKAVLDESVVSLNATLKNIGYELRPVK